MAPGAGASASAGGVVGDGADFEEGVAGDGHNDAAAGGAAGVRVLGAKHGDPRRDRQRDGDAGHGVGEWATPLKGTAGGGAGQREGAVGHGSVRWNPHTQVEAIQASGSPSLMRSVYMAGVSTPAL